MILHPQCWRKCHEAAVWKGCWYCRGSHKITYGYFFHAVAIAGTLKAERSRGFREGWDIAYWDGPIVPKAPVHEPRDGVYVKGPK